MVWRCCAFGLFFRFFLGLCGQHESKNSTTLRSLGLARRGVRRTAQFSRLGWHDPTLSVTTRRLHVQSLTHLARLCGRACALNSGRWKEQHSSSGLGGTTQSKGGTTRQLHVSPRNNHIQDNGHRGVTMRSCTFPPHSGHGATCSVQVNDRTLQISLSCVFPQHSDY